MFVVCWIMYYFCKLMAGIYIHIPFCEKRCFYCDFYSTTDKTLTDSYIDAVVKELSLRIGEISGEDVITIYIGGGTPSQLSIHQLNCLVSGLKSIINFNTIAEFTIEVNPDDVYFEYMKECRSLGINRVSMGIQSFVDSELVEINRRHNASQAMEAVSVIRQAGFRNISIDLIYGLPLQTQETWLYSLEEAIKLDVPHISCYNLSYEEGTVLYKRKEKGEIVECSEDDCVKMYETLVAKLIEAGYVHYEISNFAKPGQYSRHNSNYWNLTPYIGLGASAHSFDGTVRRYNPMSIKEYIKGVNSKGFAYAEESETIWERYNEYVMINLRTMWGIKTEQIRLMFGKELYTHFKSEYRRFVDSGEMRIVDGAITITEKGIMLSDYIIRNLMYIP